jgi:hypothetical protein
MNKHTPGPWKIEGEKMTVPKVVDPKSGDLIASIYVPSNARLIAAAPDLLEACKLAYPLLLDHAQFSYNEAETSAITRLEEAIDAAVEADE